MFDSSEQRSGALEALFQDYEGPAFSIRLWDGWHWSSSAREAPACTIVLHNVGALETLLVAPDEITLSEAFIRRDLDIQGDIFSVFDIAEHILSRPHALRHRIWGKLLQAALGLRRFIGHGARHSLARDRAAIAHHYDQPIEFFRPWLGRSLAYSCAYFRSDGDSLDLAQEQKFALICQKLRLQPGDRFLDIGCGWGGLIVYAADRHRAEAHGITLSRGQFDEASRRIRQSNLGSRCEVAFRDYRRLNPARESFDKIASIGMYEHVGLANLRRYFRTARSLLKPGGVFLNHGIARADSSPPRKNSFIDRYVFPDGHLVTLPQALQAAESERLEIRDVENLREHYEMTLRRWVIGLQSNAETLLQHVSMEIYRIWLLYMSGCAAAFRRGDIALYQVLFSRPDRGDSHLPLTREDWYSSRPDQETLQMATNPPGRLHAVAE